MNWNCYFGIPILFRAPLLTLSLVGRSLVIGQENIADVHCLFVIRLQATPRGRFPFGNGLLVFTLRAHSHVLLVCLITITGVSLHGPQSKYV